MHANIARLISKLSNNLKIEIIKSELQLILRRSFMFINLNNLMNQQVNMEDVKMILSQDSLDKLKSINFKDLDSFVVAVVVVVAAEVVAVKIEVDVPDCDTESDSLKSCSRLLLMPVSVKDEILFFAMFTKVCIHG